MIPTESQSSPTIDQTVAQFLDQVRSSRSQNTHKTYRFALQSFKNILELHGLSPTLSTPKDLKEEMILWVISGLRGSTTATERLYLSAVTGFFEYLADEGLADFNLVRVRSLIRKRARRPGTRLPQFPRQAIEDICDFFLNKRSEPSEDPDRLIYLRDRAFLITLADTGLRVHEACALMRGMIDWNEGKAVIIGKGDKQAVVRFSRRSLRAIKDYLSARAALDGSTGRPLASLPIFARHDKGIGKKVKGITTKTGREIVDARTHQVITDSIVSDQITPHSFRHYFVTVVLRGTGNLKIAQELARHSSITTTTRYAHLSDDELDQGYEKVFE